MPGELDMKLFSFGCSFTKYQWPTWADILSKSFDRFENWGIPGAGNHYIYNALVECHLTKKISSDDTVAIMWSSTGREDRYVKGKWLTPGNIYNSDRYDRKFIEEFVDVRGFILRDLALIYGAKKILDSIGCRYIFLSMVPITVPNDYHRDDSADEVNDVLPYYTELLDVLNPSIFQVIFNYDWDSRPFDVPGVKNFWKKRYDVIKDPSWPELKNKKDYQSLPLHIRKECEEIFGFFIPNINNQNSRSDYHPTPLEHLEYLDALLKDFEIDTKTRDWIADCDKKVRDGTWDNNAWTFSSMPNIKRW